MTDWNTLMTGAVKHDVDGGYRVLLSGDPEANALVDAVAARYHAATGRERQAPTEDLVGRKVTVLNYVRGNFGASYIDALSGTIFPSQAGGLAILPKGRRSKGYRLPSGLLAIESGFNKEAQFEAELETVKASLPTLRPLSQERLADLPERGNDCTLAVFGTYPFMGEPTPATVWLCHSYIADEDIVENVLYIDPSVGVSEYGSCYGRDLLRWNVGEVVDFQPISFSKAIELTDKPYEDALSLVAGKVAS